LDVGFRFRTVPAVAARWLAAALVFVSASALGKDRHLLYVAVPGVFNHHPDANYNLRYGGIGIIVFDMDHDFKFV
jgi:hypothetical protein